MHTSAHGFPLLTSEDKEKKRKYGNVRNFITKWKWRSVLWRAGELLKDTHGHEVGPHVLWWLIFNKSREILEWLYVGPLYVLWQQMNDGNTQIWRSHYSFIMRRKAGRHLLSEPISKSRNRSSNLLGGISMNAFLCLHLPKERTQGRRSLPDLEWEMLHTHPIKALIYFCFQIWRKESLK